MTHSLLFSTLILVCGLVGCYSDSGKVSKIPLIAKDTTKKLEKSNNLLVFVGRKLALKQLPYEKDEDALDNAFVAQYEILLRVYGYYQSDTIQFKVYDHYGLPFFSKYDNVLLYVVKHEGQFYHIKYTYNDVYKTKEGRWAGPYAYRDYEHPGNETTNVKPIKLDFEDDPKYPITKDDDYYGIKYPEPYFKLEGKYAKIIYGNYIEDLFTLKKNGDLSYAGYFGDTIVLDKPVIQEIIVEEIIPDSSTRK